MSTVLNFKEFESHVFVLTAILLTLYTGTRYFCAFSQDYLTRRDIRREMRENADDYRAFLGGNALVFIALCVFSFKLLAMVIFFNMVFILLQKWVVRREFFYTFEERID